MSEVPSELPVPLVNYVRLIMERRQPYYDVVKLLLKEMEIHYKRSGVPETFYTVNPRVLQEEIEKKVKSEKLTRVNICRTILALLYGSNLREEEDFYVTTTSGGRKNYHIRVNQTTLNNLTRFL
ncbi:MAG: hypothetical protein QXH37_06950 [Candidatus Bathyarchaeia archaeon]